MDWEDLVLKRWFDTIVKKGTAYSYRTAFRAYTQYTKLSPSQMIDEALEDSKKDPRQRTDILLTRILGFYTWLKTEYPLKLDLHRPKTGTDFFTFLGRDAIEAVKAYISDMKARGVNFTHNIPLFLQDRGKQGMKTNNVQDMMREVAIRAGFIDTENNGKDFNPLGPHALRESFGSIMTNSGIPDTVVDFWLGHEIGELAEAYKSVQLVSLEKMYLDREKLLSITAAKVDVEEIKERLKVEMEQQNRQLQVMVNSLVTENMDLKNRMQGLERKFSDIEKTVSEMHRTLEQED